MNLDNQLVLNLMFKALDVRRDILWMIKEAGSGHPGGSLSAVEILTALYFEIMNIRPDQPDWSERDRFILSKGHAAPVMYAILAERGFFQREELLTFSAPNTRLQKHIDMELVPGAELSTGSLAQGMSVAVGMAMADRIDQKNRYVYVLIGDGESQEGQIWEASMAASQFQLDHLIVFLDFNHCQVDGYVEDICNIDPVVDKWRSFNWHVQRINGHDIPAILEAIHVAQNTTGKPHMIISDTTKGKDISFMENRPEWHAKGLSDEEFMVALTDLCQIAENNGYTGYRYDKRIF